MDSADAVALPRVEGNFRRNIENISADVQQEHGFLEVVREAIPNATDHGASNMHLAVFPSEDTTSVLFLDDGRGMDTSPLPSECASSAQSSASVWQQRSDSKEPGED